MAFDKVYLQKWVPREVGGAGIWQQVRPGHDYNQSNIDIRLGWIIF